MAGKLPSAKNQFIHLKLSSKARIGIVVSEWNTEITESLMRAARSVFEKHKLQDQLIIIKVPGAFEIPLTVSLLLKKKNITGVIGLGCVIKGETRHDEYINNSISHAFMELSIQYSKPVIFGVLTTNTKKQAIDRSGGKLGNKGEESALTLLKMLQIKSLLQEV
ncbi:MAG: 6,7-dimethyl-8-ribityllumazine synthase [Saprospiraceae bacterium]|nr:6,7-dimethyl-8-ribityllumazine synthase [Saprospiraceae bacterium]